MNQRSTYTYIHEHRSRNIINGHSTIINRYSEKKHENDASEMFKFCRLLSKCFGHKDKNLAIVLKEKRQAAFQNEMEKATDTKSAMQTIILS